MRPSSGRASRRWPQNRGIRPRAELLTRRASPRIQTWPQNIPERRPKYLRCQLGPRPLTTTRPAGIVTPASNLDTMRSPVRSFAVRLQQHTHVPGVVNRDVDRARVDQTVAV